MVNSLRFLSLLLTSLLVGAMFGIWLGYNPAALSATGYVETQQNAIRALNVPLPILGAVCILLTIALAILTKDRSVRLLLIVAAVFLIAAGLITRFANQPINAIVMTWSPAAPPPEWQALRDTWWRWHVVRTAAGVAALVFALLACVLAKSPSRSPGTW